MYSVQPYPCPLPVSVGLPPPPPPVIYPCALCPGFNNVLLTGDPSVGWLVPIWELPVVTGPWLPAPTSLLPVVPLDPVWPYESWEVYPTVGVEVSEVSQEFTQHPLLGAPLMTQDAQVQDVTSDYREETTDSSTSLSSEYEEEFDEASDSGCYNASSTLSSDGSSRRHSDASEISDDTVFYEDSGQRPPLMPRAPSGLDSVVDVGNTFFMNGEELPYICSNGVTNILFHNYAVPPRNMDYYVPPSVDQCDFFGGQTFQWHMTLMDYFRLFPDNWKMQAVPEFHRNNAPGWIGFCVTCKLRFCCKTCKTPWTSKQGKVMFGFALDNSRQEGFILMKLFGQICMNKKQGRRCRDKDFQNPACYPEEIRRAMLKLSEFVAHKCYNAPILPSLLTEVNRSVRHAPSTNRRRRRSAHGKVQHRRDLCQACKLGVCQTLPLQYVD